MASSSPVRPTGRFSYDTATRKCDWDDEVYRIHGHTPGAVEPTLDLALEAKHPEDRDRVAELIDHAARTGEPFAISCRVVLGDGTQRRVLLVAEGGMCDPGDVTVVEGYYIDLTSEVEQIAGEEIHHAVEATVESRITIEQAKGALMLAYGLDAEAAFAMLRWWSRNRNVKVRDIAARLVGGAQEGELAFTALRLRVDSLLHDVTEQPTTGYRTGMAHHEANDDHNRDQQERTAGRAELLPEEQRPGSQDPQEQAEQILRESDERVEDPEGTGAASVQTSTPDQRPDPTV
ncbi:PAS and ANTAR domain-containing protein [Nocardioides sp. SYSU DS0651]|uniref:PAS and ANTAR domain-containing protein n=1 Tax=Nocardioides sp. SYSU DS0651 TaxID=3415955 RepID=UPI003F4C31A7